MHDDTQNSIVKRENKFSIEILFLFYFDGTGNARCSIDRIMINRYSTDRRMKR